MIAGTVTQKGGAAVVVVVEVDRLGNGLRVLSGSFAMTPQMVTGARFLPAYLTDFP